MHRDRTAYPPRPSLAGWRSLPRPRTRPRERSNLAPQVDPVRLKALRRFSRSGQLLAVGVDEGVDSIMGLSLNVSVEIVVLAQDREFIEPVMVVGVRVADLRSRCQRSAFVERQDAGAPHPAAAYHSSALGGRRSDGLRQGFVSGSEVQVLDDGCSELVLVAGLLPRPAASPGFAPGCP